MTTPEQLHQLGLGVSPIRALPAAGRVQATAAADVAARMQRNPHPERQSPLSEADTQRAMAFLSQVVQAFQNVNLTAALPAHDAPAFWSDPLDRFGQHLFAGATLTQWVTVVSWTTGPGRWSRVEQYGVDVSNLVNGDPYPYDGTLAFRILMGDQAVTGFEQFTEHRGSTQRPRNTYFVSNGENNTRLIQFQARRLIASPDPLTVTLNFRGWTWRPLNNYEGPKSSQMQ